MPHYWPHTEHMKLLDALKTGDQCERQDIGDPGPPEHTKRVMVRDGGDGQQINTYMRETRRRLNRLEDRLAILTRLQFMILAAIIGGIGVGLVLAFFVG